VADALPFLQHGKRVHIFTVVDKLIKKPHAGATISTHLARHGVEAALEAVKANGRSIGEVLKACC
jgi:hypothetical protein